MSTCMISNRRNREANIITAVLAVPCALAVAAGVVPVVEHIVTAVLTGAGVLGALVLMVRLVARWLRERHEDRADTLTGARWRATYAPHLLTSADRAALARAARRAPSRIGVA